MVKPACSCKPTNANDFAPAKSSYRPPYNGGIPGKIRPPLVYSIDTSIPNIFDKEAPHFVLQWTSSANRADPRSQRTPRKKKDMP